MDVAAITLKNVSVRYADKTVLEDVNIETPRGSICGLVGMNGAGKSTLFKTIMSVVPLAAGTVKLLGQPVVAVQKQGLVAYMPQSEAIDWHFPVSVWDVVVMGRYQLLGPMRKPRLADAEAVRQALEKVQLQDLYNRQIGQLSGGQRKRVFIARALAQGASILLLDEPFAGIDAQTERSLVELLQGLKKKHITTLVTTHDLSTIGTYCDHVILLNRRVVAAGPTKQVFTPENIARAYDDPFVFGQKEFPWTT